MLCEILCALAASDGREQALFGECAPEARKAFTHSCAGSTFPEIWFQAQNFFKCVITRRPLVPKGTKQVVPHRFPLYRNSFPSVSSNISASTL